jgi:hypothetical protein
MSLVKLLQTVPEFRHLRGQRHELWFILLLMIVGAMCGYWGYRPLAEFSQLYGAQVCQHLNHPLPRRLPSHSTFRRVILALDFQVFAHASSENQATGAGKAQSNPTISPVQFPACALLLFFATNDHISSALTS